MSATPVHILGSYFYHRTMNLAEFVGSDVDFLADSGAFSAHTIGKEIRVADYAAWLVDNAASVNAAITLDVIGDPAASARNTAELIRRVDGRVPIVPVFHVGTPFPVLEALCREHPYVALGGAVHLSGRGRTEAMLRWCVRAHRIAREHDVRLHGLGLTRPPYGEALPWYSIDSSYWSSAARTGTISLFDGSGMVKMRAGRPLSPANAKLIAAYGGNPARFQSSGFALKRESGPIGPRERDWLYDAGIAAWRRYELWLRGKRREIPAPRGGRVTGTGPKVYLASGAALQFRWITRVSREVVRRAAA